jgi:hypothetical protein
MSDAATLSDLCKLPDIGTGDAFLLDLGDPTLSLLVTAVKCDTKNHRLSFTLYETRANDTIKYISKWKSPKTLSLTVYDHNGNASAIYSFYRCEIADQAFELDASSSVKPMIYTVGVKFTMCALNPVAATGGCL